MRAHDSLRAPSQHWGHTCSVDDGGCWEVALAVCQAVDQTLCNRFLHATCDVIQVALLPVCPALHILDAHKTGAHKTGAQNAD